MGDRRREWRCGGCGTLLGYITLRDRGYARLCVYPHALDRIEQEGAETRYVCAACQTIRVWRTDEPRAA